MLINKRGQFYLIAAITIIIIILGLSVIPNSLRKEGADNTKIYELFAEVNINDVKILNYPGVTETDPGYTKENLENIFDKMTETYSRINKIYILIKKNKGEELYIYDKNSGIGSKITEVQNINLNQLKIEGKNYKFAGMSSNSYYLIIIEKDEQQYVIKA